ncbi:ATP F0F1 synthase synthase, partial [Salmonella enterica]|nr:ATP F0F1 synthase synthase [Salmonella enterica]
ELKYLLYGIEQRFYTTRFGNEKRLANSILRM